MARPGPTAVTHLFGRRRNVPSPPPGAERVRVRWGSIGRWRMDFATWERSITYLGTMLSLMRCAGPPPPHPSSPPPRAERGRHGIVRDMCAPRRVKPGYDEWGAESRHRRRWV